MSLRRYGEDLGLYAGNRIEQYLRDKIVVKNPTLIQRAEITFGDLEQGGGKPLKIVATDLRRREPAIFEQNSRWGSSITQAIRASTAFPFVFRPVFIGDTQLVDGGLASAAPVFLFREEQRRTRWPTFVFDVAPTHDLQQSRYDTNYRVLDLLALAIGGIDTSFVRSLPGIACIRVLCLNHWTHWISM